MIDWSNHYNHTYRKSIIFLVSHHIHIHLGSSSNFPQKNPAFFLVRNVHRWSHVKPWQVKAKVRAEIFAALDDEKVDEGFLTWRFHPQKSGLEMGNFIGENKGDHGIDLDISWFWIVTCNQRLEKSPNYSSIASHVRWICQCCFRSDWASHLTHLDASLLSLLTLTLFTVWTSEFPAIHVSQIVWNGFVLKGTSNLIVYHSHHFPY